MKRISNAAKPLSTFALLGGLVFAINTSATQAETLSNHADQISWALSKKVTSALSHADVISWKCDTDIQISTLHKDKITWVENIQLAQN